MNPRPTAFLDALAAGPLDVHQIAEALGIDTGTAVKAMDLLVQAGTVAVDPAGIYDLTDSGRSAVADALTAAMFPEREAAALVAAFDAHSTEEARALVASVDTALAHAPGGGVVLARIEKGRVTWTNPDASPGLVASVAARVEESAARVSATDSLTAAYRYPSPFPLPGARRATRSLQAARAAARPEVRRASARAGEGRAARARALIAAAASPGDGPDGTVLRLPGLER